MSVRSRIGFWSVFGIVTGSQIGSGVFMLPAGLAPYGLYGLLGWALSGMGAIALCFVFSYFCAKFPKTGGPHVYVEASFGRTASFFTGWTYWVVSWVSTTAVVTASIGYLSPLLPFHGKTAHIILELLLLAAITGLNLRGIAVAGRTEFFLSLLKFIPLLFVPLLALRYFDINSFAIHHIAGSESLSSILGKVTLLTLWGFIGLESATTPAGSVENPSRVIPRAIIFGTLAVLVLYIINSFGIMGFVPASLLAESTAPYVDAANMLFGTNGGLLISLIASIVCVGTLNAWILASGQIALGLSEDHLMPSFFKKKNPRGAPSHAILVSSAGIVPLIFLTASDSLASQIVAIIDVSVISFLFVYLICSLSFVKHLLKNRSEWSFFRFLYGSVALFFSLWVIYETPLETLCFALLFTLSGLPLYGILKRRHKKNPPNITPSQI